MIQKEVNGDKLFKCHNCKSIIFASDMGEGACPNCGCTDSIHPMCARDCECHCAKEVHETISYCPDCGSPTCPECGSHDVTQISRVTGYLQEVSGWNSGKQQELKDRKRYNAITGEQVAT